MEGRAFLDTNVLLLAMQDRYPAKKEAARRVLDRARDGSLVISTQVLMEFYSVATGKMVPRIPVPVAAEAVRSFAEMPVEPVTLPLVLEAVHRSHKSGISVWDALIVEAALNAGCTELYTEDFRAGTDYGGLKVVNPFAREE